LTEMDVHKLVLPSTSMPLGTKGTDPVAIIMSLAVTSVSPNFTL